MKKNLFEQYEIFPAVYDEFFEATEKPRTNFHTIVKDLETLGLATMQNRQWLANASLRQSGITFSVYSNKKEGVEKIFPFDIVPRIIVEKQWQHIEKGLHQRIKALNAFLNDIYGEQRIVKESKIPRHIVESSSGYLPELKGITPPKGVYIHIAGIDLIRRPDGEFVVLEDNVRTPSGVSYVLENREISKRVIPEILKKYKVHTVDDYAIKLRDALLEVAPSKEGQNMVVLTPGPFNSAYFEHSFLARQMGCKLVLGQDLFVYKNKVYVKTTEGPQRVDVIYRRIDDPFLDPEVFRKDSLLGVPGLMKAYASGNVTLANGVGNGVVDDKGIYPYVPDMIRFYLAEEPILPQVETYKCHDDAERSHVLANLSQFVVKAVHEAGGYGMLFGPKASKEELRQFSQKIQSNPRGYIGQPVVELSTCPTFCKNEIRACKVDLRPYCVTGNSTWILPGGLTRVALVKGSYIVNSSQGGGAKDTWVLKEPII